MKQFPTNPRVIERLDDLNHPCGFDVVMTIPATAAEPEHDEYICSLPDGLSPQQRQMAELIAAIPKMLTLLGDHCPLAARSILIDTQLAALKPSGEAGSDQSVPSVKSVQSVPSNKPNSTVGIGPMNIKNCLERYYAIVGRRMHGKEQMNALLDLYYSRVNAERLISLEDLDFMHDMQGIFFHMNRETKTLEDHFIPRAGFCSGSENNQPTTTKGYQK